jgi:hypothetical protein
MIASGGPLESIGIVASLVLAAISLSFVAVPDPELCEEFVPPLIRQ